MLTALTKMLLTIVMVVWVSSLAWARLRLPVSSVIEIGSLDNSSAADNWEAPN